jgi:hypothetical protein
MTEPKKERIAFSSAGAVRKRSSEDTIYEATKRRCIEEQNEARTSAFYAQGYYERGLFGRAAQEQREARYHHDQAWMRLARLIGVE